MATANQLKMLVKSHFEENNEKFNTIALQIAAHEARLGHTNLANDIRKIIESSKNNKPRLKNIDSNLQGLFLEIYPQERLSDLVVSPQIVIVKTCSDIFYTIGQKKCPMPSAKIRNYSHSHNLVSQ